MFRMRGKVVDEGGKEVNGVAALQHGRGRARSHSSTFCNILQLQDILRLCCFFWKHSQLHGITTLGSATLCLQHSVFYSTKISVFFPLQLALAAGGELLNLASGLGAGLEN